MKKSAITFKLMTFLTVLLWTSCQVQQEPPDANIYLPVVQNQEDQELPDTEVFLPVIQGNDLFPNKATVKYAQGFTIEYFDTYKRLTVTQPWSGANESFSYILVPEGGSAPDETNGSLVVQTPIKSIVTMSTTYFPFLEDLNQLDTLVGVDDVTYVYNEKVRSKAANGELTIVGGGAGGGTVNLELLIELDPDLIMTSASGVPELDAHPKLIEADLPVVLNGDYLENSPLGRAEWSKFIAAFFDQEALAEEQFDQLVARYQDLVHLAASVSYHPTVFTNTDFQGSWYVPAGESYAAILLKDAGADYLWADQPGTGAVPLAFEAVLEQANAADFWLNVGFASDLTSLLEMEERYENFSAFTTGQVYNYNKRVTDTGGMDYFESGVANPDLILADLVAIFHPELMPSHEFYYYTQLH